jgi:hypothetical protein
MCSDRDMYGLSRYIETRNIASRLVGFYYFSVFCYLGNCISYLLEEKEEFRGSSSDELDDGRSRQRKSAQEVERLVQKERPRRVARSRLQIVE